MTELPLTTLPAAVWTERADLAALVAALGNGNARYVGGAVRDTLAAAQPLLVCAHRLACQLAHQPGQNV